MVKRGSFLQPQNRFAHDQVELEEERALEEIQRKTTILEDDSQSILTKNNSPDIPYTFSINVYRGCEHGCSYCYARPYHEFLGFNAGLDFESKIVVKRRAAELLESALSNPKWQPQTIAMSGVTDCYQPLERKLKITRQCLEVLSRFRQPVGIITKNALIQRDVDFLKELARYQSVNVHISITSLDPEVSSILEPRASTPRARLDTVTFLKNHGIPVGVAVAPVIPGINEHEIPAILEASAKAGAEYAGFTVVRLPGAVDAIFSKWLETHFPDRARKVMDRIRSLHGGSSHSSNFGLRLKGSGLWAEQIAQLFHVGLQRNCLHRHSPPLSSAFFQRPTSGQMDFFLPEKGSDSNGNKL